MNKKRFVVPSLYFVELDVLLINTSNGNTSDTDNGNTGIGGEVVPGEEEEEDD
ncbi:MAG: hypothetical protein MJZ23_01320 [Paludibacteraceae bacterium]|nr:hypothetical protein [Paludibacteraceae bacterium]